MKIKLSVWAILLFISFGVFSQDQEEFTDDEISTYAKVMVWAEMETQKMSDSVEYWVKNNEKLSASAYNELSKAAKSGDISTADVTQEETDEFQIIQDKIDNQKEAFKLVYVDKIKEDIGAGLYNRLKKALKSDEELKARYDAIYSSISDEIMPSEEEVSGEN